MIDIQNVQYSIDNAEILKGVSLNVQPGLLGLIGPNGAGKTTLLRTISGYLRPTAGQVQVAGKNVLDIDMKRRAQLMALVPQNFAMDYDFTVLEMVLMGRNPHKKAFEADTPADYAIAHESIRKAGIQGFEGRSVIGLSGGEWQRMIIARALCQQSSVLLLDEPVSNLDVKHQVGILNTVKTMVRERGLVCVCVLHDLNLAYNYCDTVALMQEGKLAAAGTPADVMSKDVLEEVYETGIRVIDAGGGTYILPEMHANA